MISGGAGVAIIQPITGTGFSILVPLSPNTVNTLLVTATDLVGNTSTGSVEITETDTVSPFVSALPISGSTLSQVSIVTGTGVNDASHIMLQSPVIFSTSSASVTIPSGTQIMTTS